MMSVLSRLKMDGVSKTFGATTVVKRVSLEIVPGEVHALIGENGAGKSTLTKMIAGVHRPDVGTISIDGAAVDFRTPGDALEAGVSTVYQELNLIPELDCASNIALGREPHRMLFARRAEMNARATGVLAEVGSHAKPTTIVSALSTGERQLVEIAKALAGDAKIVIMDEPTAALSAGEITLLHQAVRRLTARGISVIYITHKLAELFVLADRVSVMRDGSLITTLRICETNKDELVATMLGQDLQSDVAQAPSRHDRERQSAMKGSQTAGDFLVERLSTAGQVRDISFRVRSGEILGMAGLVGAGRTETVRALVGLEKIVSGEIVLGGKKFKPRSPGQAQGAGVVMVPEDRKTQGLLLDQSVESNVVLPHLKRLSRLGWIDRRAVRALAQKCIDSFDVRPKLVQKPIGLLSGGNQQKVLIGRWLLDDYRVVIFDEPSKGVDIGAREGIWKMVRSAAARGAAVIVVSSETEELIALSHRILVMRQGEVSAQLDNTDLTEEEVMKHAF
jgi:rhamnose transport system ATP-binding protein